MLPQAALARTVRGGTQVCGRLALGSVQYVVLTHITSDVVRSAHDPVACYLHS
jgi:hypothetical protein